MNNKKQIDAIIAKALFKKAIMLSNFNKPIAGYTPPTLSSMVEVKIIKPANKWGK